MLVSWSTNFLLLITWTQLDLSYKSPSSRTANLDLPRPPETVEVCVKWLELGPLLLIDGLHGPEEVTPGPEDPQHLRNSVGVDGVASEAPGSDDHVVCLLPESGGEKPVNITTDEVPVKPEGLESPQGGKVPVQSVNIAVTCRAESACKSGVSRSPPVCSRAERIPEPAATSRISEDRGTPRWKNSSATFSTLLISPGLRDLGTRSFSNSRPTTYLASSLRSRSWSWTSYALSEVMIWICKQISGQLLCNCYWDIFLWLSFPTH